MRKLRGLIRLLVLSFIFGGFVFSSNAQAKGITNTFPIDSEIEKQIQKEQVAIITYNEILEKLDIALPHEENYPNYPEEFGGCYYKDGYLCVRLTEDTDEIKEKYLTLVTYPKVIIFEKVENSYNELYNLSKTIVDSQKVSFNYVGPDVCSNKVKMGVFDISDVQVQNMFEGLTSTYSTDTINEMLIVEESPAIFENATQIKGGEKISYGTSSYGTACIGGTYNGNNAILTAGHCVTVGQSYKYKTTGNVIGTGAYKRFSNNLYYDFGIIELNSNYTPSSIVLKSGGTSTLTGVQYAHLTGTTVYKYGATTYAASGIIGDNDITLNYTESGYRIKGLTSVKLTSGSSAGGDSGGPVYASNKLYGIHVAAAQGADGITTYYTPIAAATNFSIF